MRFIFALVALIVCGQHATAHPKFDTTVEVEQFEFGTLTFGGVQLASGDFDADGYEDLAVFDIFESFIAFGSPNGSFHRRFPLEALFYFDGYHIVVHDVDQDSDLDLLVSNPGPDFFVPDFYINDGTGQFERIKPPALIGVGNARMFDFNLDGYDDIVGVDLFGAVQILLATGPLTFEKFPTLLKGYTTLPDVGYVNADKYPDLLCGDKLVLMGENLVEQAVITLPFPGDALIDINGDSSAEVISLLPDAAYVRPATLRTFKIHENEAHLIQSLFVPVTANARVQAQDMDDDGDVDLVLSSAPRWTDGTGTFTTPVPCDITILSNNGESTFSLGPTLATQGLYPTSISIGQFDGAYAKDIAMANNGIGLVATGSTDIRTFGNTLRVMFASESDRLTAPAQLIAKSLMPSPMLDPVCIDLNGDGDLDFAAISTNNLHVRMGLGNGHFCDTPVYIETATIGAVQSLSVLDVNADGVDDLVSYFNNNSIGGRIVVVPEAPPGAAGQYFPGVRARSIDLPDDLPLPRPNRAIVADLDGDGDADYAGYTSNSAATPTSTLRVRFNNAGTFSLPTATAIPGGFQTMVTVDANGDLAADLAVYKRVGPLSPECACFVDWRVDLLVNDGTGAFPTIVNLLQITDPITGLIAEDFDGDGRKDLLVTSRDHSVRLLRGLPDGFDAPHVTSIFPALVPTAPAVGDFDRDGDLDIASTVEDISLGFVTPMFSYRSHSLMLLNDSHGRFSSARSFAYHPTIPGPAYAVDFDRDTDPDYIVANMLTGATLFRNSTPAPLTCMADFNGDRVIDGRDLSVLLARFGSSAAPGDPADLNSDGVIDGLDLAVVLAQFGHKCRP